MGHKPGLPENFLNIETLDTYSVSIVSFGAGVWMWHLSVAEVSVWHLGMAFECGLEPGSQCGFVSECGLEPGVERP